LQIWICDRDKNPLPRFFSGMDIFAFGVCHFLKLSDPRLPVHSRASFFKWTGWDNLDQASPSVSRVTAKRFDRVRYQFSPDAGTAGSPLISKTMGDGCCCRLGRHGRRNATDRNDHGDLTMN
jgi:hypothetical protein